MEFTAYGFNLNARNVKTIREMASVVTNQPIDVLDLRSFDPAAPEDSIVFLFGNSTQVKQAREKNYKIKIDFPDVDILDADFGDVEERRLAYEKLLNLKEALRAGNSDIGEDVVERPENIEIKEEELPQVSSTEVLRMLAQAMQENGTKEWIGTTQGGHKVRLTLEPSHSDAEINMTFSELYFMRAAMELLQLKELKIVPRPNTYWQSSPWRNGQEGHPRRTTTD